LRRGGAPLINVTLDQGSQLDQARGGLYDFTIFFLFLPGIRLHFSFFKIYREPKTSDFWGIIPPPHPTTQQERDVCLNPFCK